MFSISDKDIAAIVAASERGGQFAATVEVRRIFPGIPDNAEARRIALRACRREVHRTLKAYR